ncbi:hypothetical protein FGB62_211g014 [Gracilaria domingensis]|nr:hypothetical protein FGB62_211g014 [Gracilaria domingensis]
MVAGEGETIPRLATKNEPAPGDAETAPTAGVVPAPLGTSGGLGPKDCIPRPEPLTGNTGDAPMLATAGLPAVVNPMPETGRPGGDGDERVLGNGDWNAGVGCDTCDMSCL